MIKAIETTYKGYRFRSRTEARWAVFFDALGIRWEYEKEGFDLGEAGWYLPDFWLPDMGMWIEIKGENPTPQERTKARALCEMTHTSVGVLSGAPWFNIFRALYQWFPSYEPDTFEYEEFGGGEHVDDLSDWIDDPTYDYEKQDGNGCYYQGWLTWGVVLLEKNRWSLGIITLIERDDVVLAHAISHAYNAARSARFEHGESGAA